MNVLKPKVSVVVPVFNESPCVLKQSLGSVAAQSFSDFECLVIDESTDPLSAMFCREFCEQDQRFHYFRPDNRIGLAASLNFGIGMALGDLIARFDSDDLCMVYRLEMQVAYMDAHPDVGVLGGGLEILNKEGKTLAFRDYPVNHSLIEKWFQTTTPIAHPTVMMRKSVIDDFGGYDPNFIFAEDLDLWLRLLNRGVRFANLQDVLVGYRQENTSRNPMHFHFNLRARLRNFSLRQFSRRVFGICAVAVFCRLPAALQERIFQGLLFRRS